MPHHGSTPPRKGGGDPFAPPAPAPAVPSGTRPAWVVLLAMAALAGLPPARAGAACTPRLIDLGTLGGGYSVATAIDAQGHVVGYSETASGLPHAFLHRGLGMADLADKMPLDLQALPSRADAINAAGQVAGTLQDRQMWRYTPATRRFQASADPVFPDMALLCRVNGMAADGALVARSAEPNGVPMHHFGVLALHPEAIDAQTGLDNFSGFFSPACDTYRAAINAQGDVTWQGVGTDGGDAFSLRQTDAHGLPWGAVQHAPRFETGGQTLPWLSLSRLNGQRRGAATAYDTVSCGYRWSEISRSQALVFQAGAVSGGSHQSLGPGLHGPDGSSAASAISEDGRWVAGDSRAAGSACDGLATTATLFTRFDDPGQAPRALNVAPRGDDVLSSRALAVNDRRQVLGEALVRKANGRTVMQPFVHGRASGAVLLTRLFPELTSIEPGLFQNERGQIAGTALLNGQRRAFRIDCPTGD